MEQTNAGDSPSSPLPAPQPIRYRDEIYYESQAPLPDSSSVRVRHPESNFGRALGGIAAAALIYISSLALMLSAMWIYSGPASNQSLSDLFCICIGAVCLFLVVVFFYILLAVVPLGLLSLALCLLVIRSLGVPVRWSFVGGFAGGLTGYLGTCYVFTGPVDFDGTSALVILLGPVLATLLGQAGGSWPALSPVMIRQLNPTSQDPEQPWQFDIRQIMIATAWIAGILAALKGLGALGLGSASILFVGLMLQAVSLPFVIRLVTRIRSRNQPAVV